MAILTPAQRDRVVPRMIEDEMRESFIDYSMSVIVQRALPDVRDGLKPVHRRILYAMHEAGLTPARPYKKSATVVGDVLGKYHPHGDTAVYDSLVRMVQDFSLRYPLVDGQGNFGSIDGDNAAAYRYTEARLSPIATEMLADIDRDTVEFSPNFDDRLREPTVLPASVPNLLVNGSSGIAVGMSTNVPPHNLAEVVRAVIHLLDHPECTVDDLMAHVPGPDFPTGGIIVGTQGIRDAYVKGRGRVVMRARVYKEARRNGKEQLVVTEIPYGTNKSRILEQIAEITRAGKLADIADLRDESDRDGIRVVIELKRGADPAKVLTGLFKWTALQTTFGVISLALDRGVPREFGLKEMLERFREHRIQVVVRRSRWELERARDEAHVLEGLIAALRRIDQVIAIVRGSRNRDSASGKLQKELKLTERQADAILGMRLSRLTQLESKELRDRLAELQTRIGELEALLASPAAQVGVIRRELAELAEKYGDPRRTTIFENEKAVRIVDMLAAEEVVVTVTREGFVKQVPMPVYQRTVGRGGTLIGAEYEADYLERVLVASTEDWLMAFSADGRAYGLPVRDLPDPGLSTRGKRLHQLLELPRRAEIAGVLRVKEFAEARAVLFATAGGTVKRTSLDQFARPRSGGVEAISLRGGDRLAFVAVTDGEQEVVLAASGGRAIRFAEGEIPLMGRATQGVRGIKLDAKERLAGFAAGPADTPLVAVTARGQAKRMLMDDLPMQKRDGKGAAVVPGGREYGELVALMPLGVTDLAAVTAGGMMRIRRAGIPLLPREAPPEPVLQLAKSERILAVTPLAERDATAPVTTAEELLDAPSMNGGTSDPDGDDDGGPSGGGGGSAAGGSMDAGADGGGSGDGDGGGLSPLSGGAPDVPADGGQDAGDDAGARASAAGAAPALVDAPPAESPRLFAEGADAGDSNDAITEDPVAPPRRTRKPATKPPAPPPAAAPAAEPKREPKAASAPAPEPARPAAERKRGRKAPSPPAAPSLPTPAPEPKRARNKAGRSSAPSAEAEPAHRSRGKAAATEPAPVPEPPPPTKGRAPKAAAPEARPPEPPPAPDGRRGKKKPDEEELDLFG